MHDILSALWSAAAPYLGELMAVIIAAIVARAVVAIREWTGAQISQRHADRLSAAIHRGAVLALDRKLTGAGARELVIEYIRETVPDALASVGPSGAALSLRADATLAEVKALTRG